MKKNIKNQSGAISLFVLLSMMFFMAFMLGAFTLVNRRNITQVESLSETQKIYSNKSNSKEQYDSIFVPNSTSIVPITNIDQLQKVKLASVGNSKYKYLINGKIYTYEKDAIYVLQNDIILDLEDTINDQSDLNDILYDYILYNSSYNVNLNGHSIYYQMNDKSLWKLVCYQNIGTSTSPNLFDSTDSASANYYGKSYDSLKFSILDSGISAYSKSWETNENFEFLLMYSSNNSKFDTTKYNRWRQTNDPTKENIANVTEGTATATGYKAITEGIVSVNDIWGGLTKSTSTDTYLDGSVGNSSNTFAVGVYNFVGNNGIPTSIEAGDTAKECLLFVRYK